MKTKDADTAAETLDGLAWPIDDLLDLEELRGNDRTEQVDSIREEFLDNVRSVAEAAKLVLKPDQLREAGRLFWTHQ